MTTHVCILGIDGSGKSTVTEVLPELMAGRAGARAAAAGDQFRVVDPDQTVLAPDFAPSGRPVTARLAVRFKCAAKRLTHHRVLYSVCKIAQLACQDAAARRLEHRYKPDVVVSDGNLILSVAGRAVNYVHPGNKDEAWQVGVDRLRSVFEQLTGARQAHGWIRVAVWAAKACDRLGFRALWLPDVVTFLDVTPDRALERIRSRGECVDPHENGVDLSRARQMYLNSLEAFKDIRGTAASVHLDVDDLTIDEVIGAVSDPLIQRLARSHAQLGQETLGRTEHGGAAWKQFIRPGYLVHCLARQFLKGSWREPLFPLSRLGRHFMDEGYSASVMQDLYDLDHRSPTLLDRPYVGYPLHRAVYDRLHLLVPHITEEIARREGLLRIYTAPSGMAEDVFRSVEAAKPDRRGGASGIEITALDLDPNGDVGPHVRKRAARLGVEIDFVRGDMTSSSDDSSDGPRYDIVLFVGLSSWLPKPQLLGHLAHLRRIVKDDGVLVTDVFTPGAYALSGWHGGYRASYYGPDLFGRLLELSGFDRDSVQVEGGRDGLNHVMTCRPKAQVPVLDADAMNPDPHPADFATPHYDLLEPQTDSLAPKAEKVDYSSFSLQEANH